MTFEWWSSRSRIAFVITGSLNSSLHFDRFLWSLIASGIQQTLHTTVWHVTSVHGTWRTGKRSFLYLLILNLGTCLYSVLLQKQTHILPSQDMHRLPCMWSNNKKYQPVRHTVWYFHKFSFTAHIQATMPAFWQHPHSYAKYCLCFLLEYDFQS